MGAVCNLHDLAHVSWVGYVPCTDPARHLMLAGDDVDDLSDLSVDDRSDVSVDDLCDVSVDDLSDISDVLFFCFSGLRCRVLPI